MEKIEKQIQKGLINYEGDSTLKNIGYNKPSSWH